MKNAYRPAVHAERIPDGSKIEGKSALFGTGAEALQMGSVLCSVKPWVKGHFGADMGQRRHESMCSQTSPTPRWPAHLGPRQLPFRARSQGAEACGPQGSKVMQVPHLRD